MTETAEIKQAKENLEILINRQAGVKHAKIKIQ